MSILVPQVATSTLVACCPLASQFEYIHRIENGRLHNARKENERNRQADRQSDGVTDELQTAALPLDAAGIITIISTVNLPRYNAGRSLRRRRCCDLLQWTVGLQQRLRRPGFLAHPVLLASYGFSDSQNAEIELNVVNSHTLRSCLRMICRDFDRLLIKLADVIGRSHRAGDATYNNGRRTAPSPSQHRAPGTVCRTRSVAAHLWLS